MCRACTGNFPTKLEYDDLRHRAKVLLDKWSQQGDAAKNPAFVSDVAKLDSFRLSSGAGWGNPGHQGKPIELIFRNPHPDKGLLLYVVCNWMDYQMATERVWSEYLEKANDWISGKRTDPPRKDMPYLKNHLVKVRNMAKNSGSISSWFATGITEIACNHRNEPGNIYRIGEYIFSDLLHPSDERKRNTRERNKLLVGQCGLLGDWKRLWVLLRGLRQDNSLVRCLFERALSGVSNGQKALQYWYNGDYFDPKECQLPVDNWVKENWIIIMRPSQKLKRRDVARHAMELASQHGVSPSIFDVLFLAR